MFVVFSSSKRFLHHLALAWLTVSLLFPFTSSAQVLLGSSQLQSSLDRNDSGTAEAFPVTANSSGQINSLSVFLDGSSASTAVWVGIYSNRFDHPRNLLTQAQVTNPMPGKWNSVAIPAITVRRGRTYWLALLGVNGQLAFRDSRGNCNSQTSSIRNLDSLPEHWWPGRQGSTCIVSEFAAGSVSGAPTVSITPTVGSLMVGQQLQFAATVTGTTTAGVNWRASGGTVSATGLYTAPNTPGTYTVTATSVADTSVSASAQVTIKSPTVVSVSVTPSNASIQANAQQQFTALVSGTSNTAVSWSASGGSIDTSGLYTSPSSPGTYAITAVSAADPTKSASSSVTVSPAPSISVNVSPKTVSMPEKWLQQFSATVSGTSNTGISWAVTQGTGTINTAGRFTAPAAVETDIVTVTSLADNTKSASAIINIVPPHSVSLAWNASSSSNVASYNVYRGAITGGPYTLLQSGLLTTSYTDSNVQPGATYYYVTTAVDTNQSESAHSNEVPAVIPMP